MTPRAAQMYYRAQLGPETSRNIKQRFPARRNVRFKAFRLSSFYRQRLFFLFFPANLHAFHLFILFFLVVLLLDLLRSGAMPNAACLLCSAEGCASLLRPRQVGPTHYSAADRSAA